VIFFRRNLNASQNNSTLTDIWGDYNFPVLWLRWFRTGTAGYTDCHPEDGLQSKILLSRRSWWRLYRWLPVLSSLQAGRNGFGKSTKPIPWPAPNAGSQCGSSPSSPIRLRSRRSLNTSGNRPRVRHPWCQPIPFPHSATSAIRTFNTLKFPGIPTLPRPTFKGGTETCALCGPLWRFPEESKANRGLSQRICALNQPKNPKLKKSKPLNSPQSANETLKLFPWQVLIFLY